MMQKSIRLLFKLLFLSLSFILLLPSSFYSQSILSTNKLDSYSQIGLLSTNIQSNNYIGPITFAPYLTHRVPTFCEVARIIDINNDGRNDIVVGTLYYLFIYLQNEYGYFFKPKIYRCGSIRSIDVGDLNHDGLMDIAVAVQTSGEDPHKADSIRVFYQQSNGTLQKGGLYYAGPDARHMEIGDLNNDGLADIITAHNETNFFKVFYQLPDGRLDSSVTYLSSPIYRITGISLIGDFNNDGRNDVVVNTSPVAYYNSGVSLYLQQSDGTLEYAASTDTIWGFDAMIKGDFNSDGRMDFAAFAQGVRPDCQLVVFLQDSLGNIVNNTHVYPTYNTPLVAETGDFDMDGATDIVVEHHGWMKLGIYRQNNGMFEDEMIIETLFLQSVWSRSLAVGDVNNDNKPDIVIIDEYYGLGVFYNQTEEKGKISFSKASFYSTHVSSDKSNLSMDFTSVPKGLKRNEVYDCFGNVIDLFNDSLPRRLPPQLKNNNAYVKSYSDYGPESGKISSNSEYGDTIKFEPPFVYRDIAELNCARIADMNNDGKNDIIVGIHSIMHEEQEQRLLIFYQNSLNRIDTPYYYTKAHVASIDAKDLNGDNLTDIALVDARLIRIIFQGPNGKLIEGNHPNADSGPICVTIGDVNNDGLPDIVTSYYLTNYFRVYYQKHEGWYDTAGIKFVSFDSTKTFSAKIVEGVGSVIDVGDVTGDGLNDVVFGGGPFNNALSIYRQMPNGDLEFYYDLGVPSYLSDFVMGDFNGDGRNDLVTTLRHNCPFAYYVVFLQDSTGMYPEVPEFYISDQTPAMMEVGDFNLDGRLDIVNTSRGFTWISILCQNPSGIFDPYFFIEGPGVGDYTNRGIDVGDVNSDGKPDIVLTSDNAGLTIRLNATNITTDIHPQFEMPITYHLDQNYPNPFNPVTIIRYQVPKESKVTIKVYNILGQEVRTLVDGINLPGKHFIEFQGNDLPSGIYFYRMVAHDFNETKKMILLK